VKENLDCLGSATTHGLPAWRGVCTLKPTTGRIAHASSLPPYDDGPSTQLMLAPGPLTRSVSDLRLALAILAGRDRRDPRSVDAPLSGPEPESWRAALVTELPGAPLPASSVLAIRRAGDALRAAGWDVEDAQPPELVRVNEVFEALLAAELSVLAQHLQPVISEALFAHLGRMCRAAARLELSCHQLYVERSRLQRAWSGFFCDYPLLIGPTFARPLWHVDADLDAASGVALLRETVRFITPGNVLGLPALVLPSRLAQEPRRGQAHGTRTAQSSEAAQLPRANHSIQSVQIYADLWREDLCLRAAEVIEARCSVPE
jgi:amidase